MLKNKIIYIILIAITLIMALNTVTSAKEITVIDKTSVAILDNPGSWKPTTEEPNQKITEKGAKFAGIIQIAGISVALITLMIIGIRYMIGSTEQRAEYKKTMWPYLVGAIMVFGISTFLNILLRITQSTFGN